MFSSINPQSPIITGIPGHPFNVGIPIAISMGVMETQPFATISTQPQCACCLYFAADQWDTGYCKLHNMYVMQSFECLKFKQRSALPEGGVRERRRDDEQEVLFKSTHTIHE